MKRDLLLHERNIQNQIEERRRMNLLQYVCARIVLTDLSASVTRALWSAQWQHHNRLFLSNIPIFFNLTMQCDVRAALEVTRAVNIACAKRQ